MPNEQKELVRMHLHDFGSITQKEAFDLYGITRLAAVVWKLVHDDKMPIKCVYIQEKNRYGRKVRFGKYVYGK